MSNRECRKCEEVIPFSVIIDGRKRNLRNRKFCLNCSPFGSNNRFTDDPSRKPKRGKQYDNWDEDQKQKHRDNIKRQGEKRKKQIIELSGSKCLICNYSKCNSALEFHHKDPESKKFELSQGNIRSKNWKEVLKELKKCVMLCSNCHRELHNKLFCLL